MTPANLQATLVRELASIVGSAAVLHEEEDTRAYQCDALRAHWALPLAVALPANETEVAGVIDVCRRLAVPLVPRGAGTGLSGGARPISSGVVVSLARMSRILRVDADACLAVVEPGVRNLAISEAAEPFGLFYAPDPSSQIACSIGGNVNENAGGVHCLKYGLTLHNVMQVRGILATGERVSFGGLAPDSPGLDLLPLVIGSEGMLLVVTEVTVRLQPRPALARVAMAAFASVAACADAVASIIAEGIIPAGLEMMDQAAAGAAEDFVHAGYDRTAAAILLCETDGSETEVAGDMDRIQTLLQRAGATRVTVSASETERLRLWSGRKNAFPAAGRISRDYYCMDGTIPRRQMASLLAFIQTLESRFGLRCMNVFHAGDGNMHPLILYDGEIPGEWERAEAFGNAILEQCIALGGTVTGEHGVGVEKLDSLCHQFNTAEREQFLQLKLVFDPARLLNPDKGIPSLRRCVELGRESSQRLPSHFPVLERF